MEKISNNKRFSKYDNDATRCKETISTEMPEIEEVKNTPSFNAIINSKPIDPDLGNYLIRQINAHFKVWQETIPGSVFQIFRLADVIYCRTNSFELIQRWMSIEESYVRYILEMVPSESDTMELSEIRAIAA
jgi:hypothetical protein